MVRITVGPNGGEKIFDIHRGLICYYSKYFDRKLNGNSHGGRPEVLRLEQFEVATFQHFYNWMYTGVVEFSDGEPAEEDSTSTSKLWHDIRQLYLFSNYTAVMPLRNAAIDYIRMLIAKTRKSPLPFDAAIYANTSEPDPLRRLIIDSLVSASDKSMSKERYMGCDKELLADVILRQREINTAFEAAKFNRGEFLRKMKGGLCERYHTHGMVAEGHGSPPRKKAKKDGGLK